MFRVDLLQNKRILVTGGGTGIGNAMATRFAQLGARVYIASRRRSMIEESARQMAEATGAEVTGLVVDVRHPDQVEALIEMIWEDGGSSDERRVGKGGVGTGSSGGGTWH